MRHEKAGSDVLFFDTYALYAIVRGSSNYVPHVKGSRIATTYMNLYELYHMMLQEGNEEGAERSFQFLLPSGFAPESDTIKNAARFRIAHAKRKLSYIDCLGYAVAQDLKIPFLTGDEGFKGLPNVKFVKE